MLQGEHSAILSTFIQLPIVIKIFVLSILSDRLHRFYCSSQRVGAPEEWKEKRVRTFGHIFTKIELGKAWKQEHTCSDL